MNHPSPSGRCAHSFTFRQHHGFSSHQAAQYFCKMCFFFHRSVFVWLCVVTNLLRILQLLQGAGTLCDVSAHSNSVVVCTLSNCGHVIPKSQRNTRAAEYEPAGGKWDWAFHYSPEATVRPHLSQTSALTHVLHIQAKCQLCGMMDAVNLTR